MLRTTRSTPAKRLRHRHREHEAARRRDALAHAAVELDLVHAVSVRRHAEQSIPAGGGTMWNEPSGTRSQRIPRRRASSAASDRFRRARGIVTDPEGDRWHTATVGQQDVDQARVEAAAGGDDDVCIPLRLGGGLVSMALATSSTSSTVLRHSSRFPRRILQVLDAKPAGSGKHGARREAQHAHVAQRRALEHAIPEVEIVVEALGIELDLREVNNIIDAVTSAAVAPYSQRTADSPPNRIRIRASRTELCRRPRSRGILVRRPLPQLPGLEAHLEGGPLVNVRIAELVDLGSGADRR